MINFNTKRIVPGDVIAFFSIEDRTTTLEIGLVRYIHDDYLIVSNEEDEEEFVKRTSVVQVGRKIKK